MLVTRMLVIKEIIFFLNQCLEVGEMTLQLGALAALAEDSSLVPSTHAG